LSDEVSVLSIGNVSIKWHLTERNHLKYYL
jgi:hypothetical protein